MEQIHLHVEPSNHHQASPFISLWISIILFLSLTVCLFPSHLIISPSSLPGSKQPDVTCSQSNHLHIPNSHVTPSTTVSTASFQQWRHLHSPNSLQRPFHYNLIHKLINPTPDLHPHSPLRLQRLLRPRPGRHPIHLPRLSPHQVSRPLRAK